MSGEIYMILPLIIWKLIGILELLIPDKHKEFTHATLL